MVRWGTLAVPVLGLAIVSAVLASAALRHPLSHDESFFVTGGVLLARQGLLPYRDFLYGHTPYLDLLYAGLFRISGSLLLASRLSSVAFAVAWLAALLVVLWEELGRVRLELRVLVATASLFVVATNPIFLSNVGFAINEDLAVLCLILALLFFLRGRRASVQAAPMFLSGFFAGLATGTRLPAGLVLAALFLLLAVESLKGSPVRPRAGWLAFTVGGTLSLVPAVALILLAPSQSLFGLIQYHLLNSDLAASSGTVLGMGVVGRVAFLFQLVQRDSRNLLLFFSLVVAGVWALGWPSTSMGSRFREKLVVLVMLLAAIAGALANSPSQYHYFYPLVPLSVAALVFLLADKMEGRTAQAVVALWLGALVVVGVGQSNLEFYRVRHLLEPSGWIPVVVHSDGERIAGLSGGGPVLTLSPIYALEGGASIYVWEATGPFGWEVAPLVSPKARAAQHLVGAEDLGSVLSSGRPAAVLTGMEPDNESALVAYAKRSGYRDVQVARDLTLWIRDSAPQGRILSPGRGSDSGWVSTRRRAGLPVRDRRRIFTWV